MGGPLLIGPDGRYCVEFDTLKLADVDSSGRPRALHFMRDGATVAAVHVPMLTHGDVWSLGPIHGELTVRLEKT